MTKKETKEKSGIEFSFDSLDGAHDEIQEQSSMPNESAIEAAGVQETEKLAEQSSNVDKFGTVFDPNLHAVDKDGNPSVTPLGRFRKKRGVSKVKTVTDAQELQQKRNNATAAAHAAVDMSIQAMELLLGPEWSPIEQDGMDERKQLKEAAATYFIAKDISDFPPGVALAVVVTAYAMPRMVAGKETKTRLGKAKIWLAERVNNIKRKRKNATQPDSRDDGERKDDTSEKAVPDESPEATRHPRT